MSELDSGGSTSSAATTGASDGGAASAPTSTPPPQTTHDIAAQVVDAFAATETTGDTIDGAPLVTPVDDDEQPSLLPTAPKPQAPPKPLSVEEQLLAEFGFKQAFKPDGREHYIPRSKVLAMIGSGLKRGSEKWSGEKTQLEQQVSEHRAHLEQLVAGVRGDPRAFLQELAFHDPRYREFLGGVAASHGGPPPPADPMGEMPAPDLRLSDGSATYSLDGVKTQLIPWLTQAITASIKRDLQQERAQERQHQTQREQATQQNRQKVQGLLQEAQTWPLFGAISADGKLTEFQQEVMQVYMADKSLDLRAAYMKVAHPKIALDRNKMREEILAELNAAPRGTATPRTAVDAPRNGKPMSTAEIAARAIDRLERGSR